jgi:hypothetical protein
MADVESNTSGAAITIDAANGQFRAPSGSGVTKTSGSGTAVSISNTTSLTFDFAGTLSVTSGAGVSLSNNTGSTMNFTGSVALTTGTNAAFNATGGGTVTVTGSSNTILSTSGTALKVTDTNIGSSGLTFVSVGASGGSNGIVLNNTGTSAGFGNLTVTGNNTGAANGTGGTISAMTGADGGTGTNGTTGFCIKPSSAFAGVGVFLRNTRNPTLKSMNLQNFSNFGIYGSDLPTGFAFSGITIDHTVGGLNGDNAATDEASIRLCDVAGTATMTTFTAKNGVEDNFTLQNDSAVLTSLTVTSSTFSDTNTVSPGNDAVLLKARGTGAITASFSGSTFARAHASGLQATTENTGSINLTVDNSTFATNNIGFDVSNQTSPVSLTTTFKFSLTNSGFSTTSSTSASPINVFTGSASTANSRMEGTISGNSVDNNDSPTGPGIFAQNTGNGAMTLLINGNNISGVDNNGIDVQAKTGSPSLNATITNNSVVVDAANAGAGIVVAQGVSDGDNPLVCANILGNTSNSPAGSAARVRDRWGSNAFRLPGYSGGATDTNAVAAYLIGRNTLSGAVAATAQIQSGIGHIPDPVGFTNGGSACVLPT